MIATKRSLAVDWLLILLTFLLLGLGLLMVSSATAGAAQAGVAWRDLPVVHQVANMAVSLVALLAASLIDYRIWGKWRWPLFGAALTALGLVLLAGHTSFGAQSWFQGTFFALQPSELAKIALIIVLARYFGDHQEQVKQGTGLIVSALILLPCLALIILQPDFGMAAVLGAIWLGMLFVAGVRLRHLLLLAVLAIVLAPLVWNFLLSYKQGYVSERILLFLHPQSDPTDKGYNVIQALISVGSGGLWGKGLGQGSQSRLAFLRVRHTDYIFSVLAEELGFVGCMLLLVLLAGLLMRVIRISATAGDAYGRLLASGVAIMIFTQIAVNIGFNVGLLPVTGLPLPLISYGGSSLIATLIGLGLVQSVTIYHQPPEGG